MSKLVEKSKKVRGEVRQGDNALSFEATEFSDTLPPPNVLREYKDIIPDAPERMMRMSEKEQNTRSTGILLLIISPVLFVLSAIILATIFVLFDIKNTYAWLSIPVCIASGAHAYSKVRIR